MKGACRDLVKEERNCMKWSNQASEIRYTVFTKGNYMHGVKGKRYYRSLGVYQMLRVTTLSQLHAEPDHVYFLHVRSRVIQNLLKKIEMVHEKYLKR